MRFPFFSPDPPSDRGDDDPGAEGGANGDAAPPGMLRLIDLRPGQRGVVQGIDGEPSIVRRLMELGLVPGTTVEFIRRAPMGDPYELRVRGTHLSIRRSEAGNVHVELA